MTPLFKLFKYLPIISLLSTFYHLEASPEPEQLARDTESQYTALVNRMGTYIKTSYTPNQLEKEVTDIATMVKEWVYIMLKNSMKKTEENPPPYADQKIIMDAYRETIEEDMQELIEEIAALRQSHPTLVDKTEKMIDAISTTLKKMEDEPNYRNIEVAVGHEAAMLSWKEAVEKSLSQPIQVVADTSPDTSTTPHDQRTLTNKPFLTTTHLLIILLVLILSASLLTVYDFVYASKQKNKLSTISFADINEKTQ